MDLFEMAERSKAAVLPAGSCGKTVDSKGPGVRIPLSPLKRLKMEAFYVCNLHTTESER